MNVLIACGGTGGHLFPGVALAEELVKRGHTPYLVVSEKKVDKEASEKYSQYAFIAQPSRPKPATISVKMIGFILSLFRVTSLSKRLIKQNKIDAVIGMGGFTCFGPIFAGKSLNIPTFLHDSNAVPGKSNRFLSKYVNKVLLGLEPAMRYFTHSDAQVVGTPLRDEMKALPSRAEAAAVFGISPEKKTVLVFGGSQGAQQLNTLVVGAAKISAVQYVHVAGSFDYARVVEESAGVGNHFPLAFCNDMPAAYAVADLVVCRSGASSMTELSYLGLPSILVPYPVAADDHQTKNAEAFSHKKAAILCQERDLTVEKLESLISELINNEEKREMLSRNIKSLSQDPAGQICDLIETSVK